MSTKESFKIGFGFTMGAIAAGLLISVASVALLKVIN